MTEPTKYSQLADQILKDPLVLQKLCDRVYALMLEEVRNQSDRIGYFNRRF
jgi:hypothetical protein